MDIFSLILCIVTIIVFIVSNIMLLFPQKKKFALPQFLYLITVGLAIFEIVRNIFLFIEGEWFPRISFWYAATQTFFLGLLLLYFIFSRFRNAEMRSIARYIIDETNIFCRKHTRDCLFHDRKQAILVHIDRYFGQGFYGWNYPDQLSLGPTIEGYIDDRFSSFGAGGEYIDYAYLLIQGLQLLSPTSFNFDTFIYCETHLSKRHYSEPWVLDRIKEFRQQDTSLCNADIEFWIIKHLYTNKAHYDEREMKTVDRLKLAKEQLLQAEHNMGEYSKQSADAYIESLIYFIESKS